MSLENTHLGYVSKSVMLLRGLIQTKVQNVVMNLSVILATAEVAK